MIGALLFIIPAFIIAMVIFVVVGEFRTKPQDEYAERQRVWLHRLKIAQIVSVIIIAAGMVIFCVGTIIYYW